MLLLIFVRLAESGQYIQAVEQPTIKQLLLTTGDLWQCTGSTED